MKKGKELKITTLKNYNVSYGSVNNKEPKALYINISAWAQPEYDDCINYHRVIRDLDKKVRQSIYHELTDNYTLFLKDRTIVDFDIRESGVKYGKRSFTNCEITLFIIILFLYLFLYSFLYSFLQSNFIIILFLYFTNLIYIFRDDM